VCFQGSQLQQTFSELILELREEREPFTKAIVLSLSIVLSLYFSLYCSLYFSLHLSLPLSLSFSSALSSSLSFSDYTFDKRQPNHHAEPHALQVSQVHQQKNRYQLSPIEILT
jgi:hypothetical protein